MARKSQTFRLSINTGNAAFDDNGPAYELARILRELADRIDGRACLPDEVTLYDINGNRVGLAKIAGR